MDTKELFNIIVPHEYENVTVRFENITDDEIYEKINNKYDMFFCVLSEDEKKLYLQHNDKNFKGTSEYIGVYNLEIQKYYEILSLDETGANALIMKKLQKYRNDVPEEYLLIMHKLLHEIGHYKQYLERNKNVYEYSNWCYNEICEWQRKMNSLTFEIDSRREKGIKPLGLNKKERIDLSKLAKEYRNFPKEKEADDFAYANMKEAIEKLKVHLHLQGGCGELQNSRA